jgi:hypothetical protein
MFDLHQELTTDHEPPVVELTTDAEYAQEQPRLVRFFGTTIVLSLGLLHAACSLHWAHRPLPRGVGTAAFGATAVLCLAVGAVSLLLSWSAAARMTATKALPTRRVERRLLNRLCAAVHASSALLMLAPVGLLVLVADKAYAFAVVVPLGPVGASLFPVVRNGARFGFAWGAAQYEAHEHDLRRYFGLAAGVTVPTYVALLSHAVSDHFRPAGSAQRRHHDLGGVDAVECLLLYASTAGLALMLLATSPPALCFRHTRAVVVNHFLGVLADALLALVGLAALVATAEIAGGLAALAPTTNVIAACAIFAKEHEDEPDRRGQDDTKDHLCSSSSSRQPVAPLVVNSLAFGTVMLSYSALDGGRAFSWPEKACLVAVASLLVGNLSQMALQRRAVRTDSVVTTALSLFDKVNKVTLLIAALGCMAVLATHKITASH